MMLPQIQKVLVRCSCSNSRKVIKRCWKVKHTMFQRRFNDSAIITRETEALKPFSEVETKLILAAKVDVESILSCRAIEDSDPHKFAAEDAVFDSFKNKDGLLPVGKILKALTSTGIRKRDPRLKEMMSQLSTIYKLNQETGTSDSIFLDRNTFRIYCAAYSCFNRSDKDYCKENNISFHGFPLKEPDRVSVPVSLNSCSLAALSVTQLRHMPIYGYIQLQQRQQLSSSVIYGCTDINEAFYCSVVKDNIDLVSLSLKHQLVIPEFKEFTQEIENFYWKCKLINGGKVASYIPQLAKYNPDYWGVSLCTVDGQRFSIGDTDIPFTIQSAGKPLNYGIALSNLGPDTVHDYVGQEPSGRMFNELVLDCTFKPHNPMVNAGAIVTCSLLLYLIEGEMKIAEKFDWVYQYYKALAGDDYLGFNNAIFMSEREAADRNYAIGFYMKENKCFPKQSQLREIMDFYFQMCSLEVNCETLSVITATLANGGICPTTNKRVLESSAVRNVLSLMHSCGMYDYSGQFAFKVGLPAKSGVSGCTMVVVPNVMGFCLWSPPLDVYGNSVRGVKFCEELINIFSFHNYDNLRHHTQKKDPRIFKYDMEAVHIMNLLYGAGAGDLAALRRSYISGVNMQSVNCEGRTALHVAAAQGHYECVEFLLNVCKVNRSPKDRWGRTPLEEAQTFNYPKVVKILHNYKESENSCTAIQCTNNQTAMLVY